MAGFNGGSFEIELGVGTSAGGVASVANPEGRAVVVTALVLTITTGSTGASTLDAGIAADGTTLNDGLIDGLSGATPGVFTNVISAGSNGKGHAVWAADKFLTISQASGAVAGLKGTARVTYIPA